MRKRIKNIIEKGLILIQNLKAIFTNKEKKGIQ